MRIFFKKNCGNIQVLIYFFSHYRDSSLAAAALADVSIVVLDAQQRTVRARPKSEIEQQSICVNPQVVRRFEEAHLDQVTDLCFSGDSRWVVSASLDRTVKVWDVPTGEKKIF